MPPKTSAGRRGARAIDTNLCRRCQLNAPAVTVRTEPLCQACFCKYVSTKIVKRMETFRVRHSEPGQERNLLLPLSFGPSSTALLHVLSQHLIGQSEKTGRTGFRLHVVHIVDDTVSTDCSPSNPLLEKVKSRYPVHTYDTSLLSDIFSFDEISLSLLHDGSISEIDEEVNNTEKLELLFASTGSATSRADMRNILMRRLLVAIARTNNCEAILWGDSTTRLAERTLGETAKGRGYSLPWIVADGESPLGVPCYYPVRELLSKEIADFASLVDPPLDELLLKEETKPAVSTKNTTIDQLMRQYFESVERDYPSVVANVVKTTGKLQAPPLSAVEKQCELCDMPLDGQAPERSRLCYGCIRTFPRAGG